MNRRINVILLDIRNMVVLVDEKDRPIGLEDKLKAHQNGGRLHKAISVLVFNGKGETLLQQRAMTKYHAPGKWANTCCSHPMDKESSLDAAHRRLKEEMGFDCNLKEAFEFIYKADVGGGLTEYEYDHVFFGDYEGEIIPNCDEVMAYRWEGLDDVKKETKRNPGEFASWFVLLVDEVIKYKSGRRS